MTKTTSSLRKSASSLLFLAVVLLGAGSTETSKSASRSEEVKVEVGTELAAAGDWQRPAPVTWSSRFETRWTARWGATPKYIV